MIQHLETDCENVFRNQKTQENSIQFTIVFEDASLWKRVSTGMCCKTIADVDDGFGDRTPAFREYTHPRADSDSRIYAAIPGRTMIGPVLQVHIVRFRGTQGIEIQIPTTAPNRSSWVVILRGRIAMWMSYISEIQDTIPKVLNYFWKDLLQKRVKLVLQKWSNPASRKLMQRSSKIRRIQCTFQKKLFLLKKGSGMTCLPTSSSKETLLKPESQNWSWDWYVMMTKMNEKLTELFVGVRWVQNCETHFRRPEGTNSRTQIGFNTFKKEATRWGSSIAWIPKISYCLFVPFKGTLVGTWQRLSWWVTSKIHTNGKNSCFIEDVLLMSLQSSNQESSLEDEKAKEDRPSSPHFSVHHYSEWQNCQDAVYWINLAQAQDKGLRFCPTRSHAVKCIQLCAGILHLQSDFSKKGVKGLYLKDSRRFVKHRRLYSKSAWQSQQQKQQQQDTAESASFSTRKLVQREEQDNPTDNPELPSVRKLKRSTESLVEKEEPDFLSRPELKELHNMWSWKMKKEWCKFQK